MKLSNSIYPPKGFLFAGIRAGIKKADQPDLGLIVSENQADAAALFTTNRFQAAPVLISRKRIAKGKAKAVLVNSGNANCGLGAAGLESARKTGKAVSKELGVSESAILLASTGVIGEPFPADKICAAIPALVKSLNPFGYQDFTRAIMTTDTREKISFRALKVSGRQVRILGMAKGAGMIQPQMATMLGFVLTDAQLKPKVLDRILREVVPDTFNRITIDGDTSTNDTLLVLASGASRAQVAPDRPGFDSFRKAFHEVCLELATMMVADGEGASRWYYVKVEGAKKPGDAEKIARRIANSPLVKTAISASDPNWGRIIAAAGIAGVKFDPRKAALFLQSADRVEKLEILKAGARSPSYRGLESEKRAARILGQSGFRILFSLGPGRESFEMITCDFTQEYVRINAEYRS